MRARGKCGDWTAEEIRQGRLTNPRKPLGNARKLRLQEGDEEEYRLGLEGNPTGSGAVAQAWKSLRRLVARNDVAQLLEGLRRFRVVSIGLTDGEDPQQIFESLNATGKPLTESEKIKNWLLMGLADEDQLDLYQNHWMSIERSLGVEHSTEPIDLFFRDLLRWKTGEVQGINRVYETLRRWAVKHQYSGDRSALCREFSRIADLYGNITGTAGQHRNRAVERELIHLRALGIDTHRPLTLRLLNDEVDSDSVNVSTQDVAEVLASIGTWTTRLWLSDRQVSGMNRAVAELSGRSGPHGDEGWSQYWIGQISRLRNTRVGVPSDELVQEGIRNRKAYGGSATRSAFAVLCALMEAEHREESPAREHLTIEHVMPRTLTAEWKRELGANAEDFHGKNRDTLANLTLSGDLTNSAMGASTFGSKREIYARSPIGLTRRLTEEHSWGKGAIGRRAAAIAELALNRWPWKDRQASLPINEPANLRWKIGDGPWSSESHASQMVLNIVGALLDLDPSNAERLSGDAIIPNIHRAGRFPPGTQVGSLVMRAIPGHEHYVMYPYAQDYPASAERCRRFGERCQAAVEVEFTEKSHGERFWVFLRDRVGGLPGQKDSWRGASQGTAPINSDGDYIGVYVGNQELIWLYIRSSGKPSPESASLRMRSFSWKILEQMGDQISSLDVDGESAQGRSVSIQRSWDRDDHAEWPEAADWIMDQFLRLKSIGAEKRQ